MLRHAVARATSACAQSGGPRGLLGAVRFNRGSVRRVDVVLLDGAISRKGGAGDVIEVRPGYARNKLIPQKLAKYATAENVARFGKKTLQDAGSSKTRAVPSGGADAPTVEAEVAAAAAATVIPLAATV